MKRKRKIREPKKCDCGCGKLILNPRSNQKYYEDSCRHKIWERKHPRRKPKTGKEMYKKNTTMISVRIPNDLYKWYHRFKNTSFFIRRALKQYHRENKECDQKALEEFLNDT